MGDWITVKAENIVKHRLGTYYLRAKVGGKIIRKSLHTKSLAIAKIKRDSLLPKLRAAANLAAGSPSVSLIEALEMTRAWYARLPSYQKKPASLRYRNQLLDVLARSLPNRSPGAWTASELAAWWASPGVTQYSAQRRNNLLGSLRKLLELCRVQGDLTRDLQRVKVSRTVKVLPSKADFPRVVAEIRSARKANSVEAANFVEFMAYSGCRVNEAAAVCWEDVEVDWIVVRGGVLGTKNNDQRRVPLIEPMKGLLERMRYEGAAGPLFEIQSPYQALVNACVRLNVPRLTPHRLRDLFATSCVEAGVDFRTLAEWLGHKDRGILAAKTYSHVRDDHAKAMAARVVF